MLKVRCGTTGTALVAHLADVLATPLDDVFAPEHIAVHSPGIERWVSQQLSRRLGRHAGGDGIAANLSFPFPAQVVSQVMAAAGVDLNGLRRWQPDALAWRLLEEVDAGLPPALQPLQDRLEAAGDRRMLTVQSVARLLHRYSLHRPDMVLAWLDGRDDDGAGGLLPAADAWQPALLRTLAQRIAHPGIPQAAVEAIAALRSGASPPAGLRRLALFGFTALPAAHMAVLAALAEHVEVTLLLLHPSEAAWRAATGVRGTLRPDGLPLVPARPPVGDRGLSRGPDQPSAGSRLFRAWGRDVRELQVVVQTLLPDTDSVQLLPSSVGDSLPADAQPTLLQRIQLAIRDDDGQPATTGGTPADDDQSLTMHACPGPARQVQVLRDVILHALADDPTLQPRDIVVMCPDVEVFAPLVTAHLAGTGAEGTDLRVRLADRSLTQTNPMLRLLDTLLSLAATRVTASRLVDLLGSDVVRRRFGLDEQDIDTLEGWMDAAAIRWGMDASDRVRFGLGEVRANSVDEGLDRLLLGVAMADEDHRSLGAITPVDDMEGGAVRLAGRLAEAMHRLGDVLRRMRQAHTLQGWAELLGQAVDLLGRPAWDAQAERVAVTALLQDLAEGAGPLAVPVTLAELRDALAEPLRGGPARANHMTGDLTVCTLVPMRSVPHRMVCLLGMDDEAFPRRPRPLVDDLISRQPRMGDQDPRSEDRQLLLDAVMAAEERLVVLWTGTDVRTGTPIPPCAPIAELRRTLDALAGGGAGSGTETITTPHPLHSHDPAAFTGRRPSFDTLAHRAARARLRLDSGTDARTPSSALRYPMDHEEIAALHVQAPQQLSVDDLQSFLTSPAQHFVRHVLGVYVPEDPEAAEDAIPIALDGLRGWELGQALLTAGAAEGDQQTQRVLAAVRGQGNLPPPPLQVGKIDDVVTMVGRLADLAAAQGLPRPGTGERLEVRIDLDGMTLQGALDGVSQHRLGDVSYSKVTPKRIIRSWVALLAATAMDPDRPWQAVLVGRQGSGRNVRACATRLPALGATPELRERTARTLLADLLRLYRDGQQEPMIAPAETAHAYAEARVVRRLDPAGADANAATSWDANARGWSCDSQRPAHVLLLGDCEPYEVLASHPPRLADQRPGQAPEPHRLAALAMRIWAAPLQRLEDAA